MRKALNIGVGIGTAGIVAVMAAGAATAATSGSSQRGTTSAAATAAVNRHITKAQARTIARARVPHSRVVEVESDDLHDRAVWKVQLATRHGRVVVDVDKKTGKATILRNGGRGGGHDDAVLATSISGISGVAGWSRMSGDDRRADAVGDDQGRDARDNDGARDERADRHDRGDHRDHDRGDHRDNDRGDDGPGR